MAGEPISSSAVLTLSIIERASSGLDFGPLERMVAVLNRTRPDWLRGGNINLKLVDDKGISALNKEYAGNDYATDVLSFSYLEGLGEPANGQLAELGDMVISLETAERQARAAGTRLSQELALLALHGILHIFGLDHVDRAGQIRMDQLQADLLQQAGVTYRDFKWTT
ncbi:rRNA maturation RNase YbeY [Candidatus Parcubacteria bacterium]|nr:rRNA maturation RNase YbeY [Candidatus Parcubacteria bacterium]